MLIASFPAGPWQANCYLAATQPGTVRDPQPCVVVDPGVDAVPGLEAALAEHHLVPVGVVATHGHLDHIGTVAEVCATYGIPLWIHPDDRPLLTDPAAGLDLGRTGLVEQMFPGVVWTEPDDVRDLADGQTVDIAGLSLHVTHAPGHRPGCVLLTCVEADGPVTFTGDVVFAGSIGRTDLPGGDMTTMARTLQNVVLAIPDETTLLPGHGPATTMAKERVTNPYLRPDFLEQHL